MEVLRGIGAIVALLAIGRTPKKVVGGTVKVVGAVTKSAGKIRKPVARKHKQRGVTLGQVIALPLLAITSVFFGSRKSWKKRNWTHKARWVEPGSTYTDPNDRFKF